MGYSRSRVLIGALMTCSLVVTFASPASARAIAAGPGSFAAGYATPVVVAQVGGPVTFFNGDAASHNVIATDAFIPKKAARKVKWCGGYDKGQCPLFWSATITAGEETEVLGLERLESGKTYAFVCSLHPAMRGTLVAN